MRQIGEERGEEGLEGVLLPIESALVLWHRIELDEAQALALGRGQAVQLTPGLTAANEVNAVNAAGRSLGIAELDAAGVLRAKRLFRWAAQGSVAQ